MLSIIHTIVLIALPNNLSSTVLVGLSKHKSNQNLHGNRKEGDTS